MGSMACYQGLCPECGRVPPTWMKKVEKIAGLVKKIVDMDTKLLTIIQF